jgi:hypothetical protein
VLFTPIYLRPDDKRVEAAIIKVCAIFESDLRNSRVRDHFSFASIESSPATVSSSPNRVEK